MAPLRGNLVRRSWARVEFEAEDPRSESSNGEASGLRTL